jgi:hypothetical protein
MKNFFFFLRAACGGRKKKENWGHPRPRQGDPWTPFERSLAFELLEKMRRAQFL